MGKKITLFFSKGAFLKSIYQACKEELICASRHDKGGAALKID
jgi:hypothetical protein